MSEQGFRTLGVASRDIGPDRTHATRHDEAELTFEGFAVFRDPPKATAGAIIAALRRDGVEVRC